MVESVYDDVLGRDEYDVRELTPDPFPYGFYVDYLNTPHVQAAIGAFTNFSDNGAVSAAFDSTGDDGREIGTVEAMRYLICQGITVGMYAGDADYNCNWIGNEVVSSLIQAPGFSSAGYIDIKTSDGITHGQVKQSGKFSFTRIYESGHEVPFYQPLASLEYFERAIKGLDIETGKRRVDEKYKTKGPQRSTYREGNSTVQFDITPKNATYDVITNKPGAPWPKALMKRSFRADRGAGARPRPQSRFRFR
jgi:carboxypeptidase D